MTRWRALAGPVARRPLRGDRGGATVLVLAMAGLLCFVAAALAAVAGVVHAQRVAQSAADLAALASCAVQGRQVRLLVEVPGPRLVDRRVVVTAEARAGPA